MGISFDLEKPYLPRNRGEYPRAPFASLGTEMPQDADRAYEIYCRTLRKLGRDSGELSRLWGGRWFRVPVIESTRRYRDHWGGYAWSDSDLLRLFARLSPLSGDALMALGRVVGRSRDTPVESATFGLKAPQKAVKELVNGGWCETGLSKPTKAKPDAIPTLSYATGAEDRELVGWELERRRWLIEELIRLQYAYEATQSDLRSYRESGVVTAIEVLAESCCDACRKKYRGPRKLSEAIEIPIAECTNIDGCNCCVTPVV